LDSINYTKHGPAYIAPGEEIAGLFGYDLPEVNPCIGERCRLGANGNSSSLMWSVFSVFYFGFFSEGLSMTVKAVQTMPP